MIWTGGERALAQNFSGRREKNFLISRQSIYIDSLSIQPNSPIVFLLPSHTRVDSNNFRIDYFHSKFEWIHLPPGDSFQIAYQTLPFNFCSNHQIRYEQQNISSFHDSAHEIIFHEQAREPPMVSKANDLTYSGSFMRGFTAGNNQDLSFQSGFNLQMQGRLAGDVQVTASMSDKNLPIQPDGSTAQLQDFDNVFIQLKRANQSLTLGDYHSQSNSSHFLSFSKSLQGLSYQNHFSPAKNLSAFTFIDFAEAKGKYARNEFDGQDFNQGPYQLKGNEGEFYITILAGSEQIYVDGQPMQRGSDRDYVVDYNTAQITFTPLRLITRQSRIIAEFEYSNQSYLRSTIFLQQLLHAGKSDWEINFYNEQDAKNHPFFPMNDTAKQSLSEAGNKTQQAFLPGADSVAFDATKILYKKKDTLGYVIYVYSTHADSAHYTVQFAYVGEQKGNYLPAQMLSNGKVFQWIAPIKGVPQGQYEPMVPVSTPQKMQLITVGNTYHLNATTSVTAEESFSRFGANTFSKINDAANGSATFVGIDKMWKIGARNGVIHFSGNSEWTSKNFTTPERYRSVEFNRDWNVPNDSVQSARQISNAQLSWIIPQRVQVIYHFSMFQETNLYSGYNHSFNGSFDHGGFQSIWNVSLLQSSSSLGRTEFFRPSMNLSQKLGHKQVWEFGLATQAEENQLSGNSGDTLNASGYLWHSEKIYLVHHDSSKLHSAIDATFRDNYSEENNSFLEGSHDFALHEGMSWQAGALSHFSMDATYHRTTLSTDSVPEQNNLQSGLLAQASGDVHTKLSWLQWNFLFQTGSVQQPKLEYAYVQVPAGQGIYTWMDFNHDGIQQLNEFVVAPFPDQATYIRIYIPSNEFTNGFGTQINQSLSLSAPNIWRNDKGFKKFAYRFSFDGIWRQNQTLNNESWLSAVNPFQLSLKDSALFYLQQQCNGTLYFNKTSTKWAADFNVQSATSKSLVSEDFQIIQSKNETIRIRWNVHSSWSFIAKTSLLTKGSDFASSALQDFQWMGKAGELNSTCLVQTSLRLNILARMESWKETLSHDSLRDQMQQLDLNLRWNQSLKGFVDAQVSFIHHQYTGALNTPQSFAVLQGLQNGNNLLIDFGVTHKLNSLLEMSMHYEGRKSPGEKMICTGRAEIGAVF